jgi:hypothetical protein
VGQGPHLDLKVGQGPHFQIDLLDPSKPDIYYLELEASPYGEIPIFAKKSDGPSVLFTSMKACIVAGYATTTENALSGAGAPLRFLSGAGAPLRFWGLRPQNNLLFRLWRNLSGAPAPLRRNS